MNKSDKAFVAPLSSGTPCQAQISIVSPATGLAGPDPAEALDTAESLAVLNALTDKQRAVLDLLIEHKTSKEISRILGISHHTVDQRIMLARAKMGVATRGEVAQAYRRLVMKSSASPSIYERSVYDFSDVAPQPLPLHGSLRDDSAVWIAASPSRSEPVPHAVSRSNEAVAQPYHHVLPEMFDGPYGTMIRLGTIAVFAMFLILIVMGGLAMFAQLAQIIAH